MTLFVSLLASLVDCLKFSRPVIFASAPASFVRFLRQVDRRLACLLGTEYGTYGCTAGYGIETHTVEDLFQIVAGNELDIDSGDIGGSKHLRAIGSPAGRLQTELAQLAEIDLLPVAQGLDHILDHTDQHR